MDSSSLAPPLVEFLLSGPLLGVHHHLEVSAAAPLLAFGLESLLGLKKFSSGIIFDISSLLDLRWLGCLLWNLVSLGKRRCSTLGEALVSGLTERVVLVLDVHQDSVKKQIYVSDKIF